MFNCIVCFERKDGTPKTIGPYSVCIPCVKEGIMKMFHDALKAEINYPPKLGEITLDPEDFLDHFDSPKEFLQEWLEKVVEYETPYKSRFYCSGCSQFLCVKPSDGSKPNIVCFHCQTVTCYPCGADLTDHLVLHSCPGPPEEVDEFDPADKGKLYQDCPNTSCGNRIALLDGCNAMVCPSMSCGAQFCFVCGAQTESDSGHWNVGKPCPRWNHPDDPHATHDNEDMAARLQAIFEPLNDRERTNGHMRDEEEPLDFLLHTIGQEAHDALVSPAIRHMDDLPPLPDFTGMSVEQQLQAERDMLPVLLTAPIGRFMHDHQEALREAREEVFGQVEDHEGEDFRFFDSALQLFQSLRTNLSLYVNRVQLRAELADFEARHEFLNAVAYGRTQRELFERFPYFYVILAVYNVIAEIRLIAAEADVRGDDEDRAVAREEIVRMRSRFVPVVEEE